MPRFLKKRTGRKGIKPGSLILVGQQKLEKVRIRVMSFDSTDLVETECSTLQEAFFHIGKKEIAWINVDGLHDPEIIWDIGKRFDVSELILEDFMNTDHRPLYHEEENQIFIIAKLLSVNQQQQNIESDQFSLIAGPGYLLTLQEKVGTHFDPLRQRIRKASTRELTINPDYLAYTLLDCMVDNYMEIIAEIGEQVEKLDAEVINHPRKDTINEIYRLRTEMNFLRKTIFPLKEISFAFLKSKSVLIHESSREFLNDLHDHVIVSGEALDSYMLMIMDQMHLYNASISNKANEIMKTLTIFAALFIPLTFIAGIYGMNFEVIPELKWKYGYIFFWLLVVFVGGGLFIYFRKRKWF
jgi:magnesium transporter